MSPFPYVLLFSCKGVFPPRPKGLSMFAREEFQCNPNSKILILPSYAKAKGQVMASMLSSPRIRNPFRSNPTMRVFLDDEALK